MNRTRWLTLAAIIVVALAGWFVVAANRPDRIEVDAGTVVRQARFVSTVSASGEIVASRYADIGSSAMGKIVALPVAEGDRVRRGQLLARVDPVQARSDATGASEQRAALEAEARASVGQVRAAESDLAAAEAVAREAELRFARTRDLHTQGLVAAADLDSARAASEASAAQVAASRAAVDRARGGPRRRGSPRRPGQGAGDARQRCPRQDRDRLSHRWCRVSTARPRGRDGRRRHPEPAGPPR